MGIEGIEGVVEVPAPAGFDTTRMFVRVVERRPDGFVEFHFAIGDPALFVELLLTDAAFAEFCAHRHVTVLEPFVRDERSPVDDTDDADSDDADSDDADSDDADSDEWNWTMRDATHLRFKELADASEHERD